MAGVPEFLKMLSEASEIHIKKNADYSGNNDPYENFHRAQQIAEWFDRPIDKVFATIVGIKLARAANLQNKSFGLDMAPNNESVKDTYMDMMVYVGMWGAYDEHMYNRYANAPQGQYNPEERKEPEAGTITPVQYAPGERYPGFPFQFQRR